MVFFCSDFFFTRPSGLFCLTSLNKDGEISKRSVLFVNAFINSLWRKFFGAKTSKRFYLSYVIVLTRLFSTTPREYLKKERDMNEILSSQVHEHIFGGDDENNNLNGPRRLLAENLDYQQMELTTEDREDHTFNGKRSCCLFFTSRRETQIG